MIEASLEQSTKDREAEKAWEEQRRRALVPKLKAMFRELDTDGSGELDIHELRDAPEDVLDQLQQVSNMSDCEELFNILDYDGGGTVQIDEFCEGLLKAQENKPLELIRLMKQCNDIMHTTRMTVEYVKQKSVVNSDTEATDHYQQC